MGEVILVSGGCRSGKSRYAEELVTEVDGSKLYIATAPVLDSEMRLRIDKHQADRAGKGWDTIEEELNIATVIGKNRNYSGILVDCLTLWINNLMYQAELESVELSEDIIVDKVDELLSHIENIDSRVVFVINEVGMGVVPENKVARQFRDFSGRCAQVIAKQANKVVFMSCGLPMVLK